MTLSSAIQLLSPQLLFALIGSGRSLMEEDDWNKTGKQLGWGLKQVWYEMQHGFIIAITVEMVDTTSLVVIHIFLHRLTTLHMHSVVYCIIENNNIKLNCHYFYLNLERAEIIQIIFFKNCNMNVIWFNISLELQEIIIIKIFYWVKLTQFRSVNGLTLPCSQCLRYF